MTAAPGNTPGASNRLQRHTIVKRITHKKYTRVGSARVLLPPPLLLHVIREEARGPLRIIRMEWDYCAHGEREPRTGNVSRLITQNVEGGYVLCSYMYAPGMFAIQLLIFQGGTPPDSLKKKSLLSSSSIVSPVVA